MQKVVMVMLLGAWLAAGNAVAATASLLVYQVWEQGAEPYVSRILVTPDYLRLDEGAGAEGFTLFDRQQEIIYNVTPEDESVLVIDTTVPVDPAGNTLVLQEQVKPDATAPEVAGQQPLNVRLLANGELCGELVVIEGAMQDAVDALAEMKLVLARVQAATLAAMPLDMRTPCGLATNVYAPDRSLRFGLPLHERSEGRSQSLVDFSDAFEVEDEVFSLPPGYARRPMMLPGAI